MRHTLHRLSDRQIKNASRDVCDGGRMWLQVNKRTSSRSWLFRFMQNRVERYMGLGPYPDVSLSEAREKAREARRLLRDGVDPLEARRRQRDAAAAQRARSVTFDWCADQFWEAHRAGWRSKKHANQWLSSLRTHVSPLLGSLQIATIDTAHVMKVLGPLWQEKAETASRVRGRIEQVIDWATVNHYRTGENPARLRATSTSWSLKNQRFTGYATTLPLLIPMCRHS
jgi:hypothetical protein